MTGVVSIMIDTARQLAAGWRRAATGLDEPLSRANAAGWDDGARERFLRRASDMNDVERRERLWERDGWVAGG